MLIHVQYMYMYMSVCDTIPIVWLHTDNRSCSHIYTHMVPACMHMNAQVHVSIVYRATGESDIIITFRSFHAFLTSYLSPATTRLHPKQGRGDSITSRPSGVDTTPKGSEQETIGNGEPDASTKEVAATPSQNIAPKLRVQVYKLENLADASFTRASNSNSASSGWTAALPTRGLLPSETKLPNEQRSVKEELFTREPHHHSSSLSREEAVKLSSSSLQSGEDTQYRERSRETVAAASTEVGARPERLELEARDLEAAKETSTDMDIRPGYDRLVIGRKVGGREDNTASPKRRGAIERQRGSGKYDKLSEKKGRSGRMRAPIYGAMSDLEESFESLSGSDKEVNGGWDWRKGADEGAKYFIGGRGRESEMEGSGSAETKGREGRDEGDSVGNRPGLKERLEALSTQLHGHIQAIADREKSNLQSLPLYIHMGEVKVPHSLTHSLSLSLTLSLSHSLSHSLSLTHSLSLSHSLSHSLTLSLSLSLTHSLSHSLSLSLSHSLSHSLIHSLPSFLISYFHLFICLLTRCLTHSFSLLCRLC